MPNWLTLLCLLTIVPIFGSSQTTSKITITNEQLKTANIIFAEHAKFSSEIPLLKYQVTNLKNLNKSWEKTDSIRKTQLVEYYGVIRDQDKSIEGLQKSLKRQRKVMRYGVVSSVILIVTCLLVK